jgi:hypoxanthine phosphoribosyltransferase
MAKEISKKFNNTDEKPLLLLTMLNGVSYFASDLKTELCNRYGLLFKEDAIRLSRYDDSHQGGKVTIERLPTHEQLVGKQVLIIEDLIEAGVTLHATIEALKERGVQENDIYVAVFTNKINARQKGYEVKLDFVGYPMEEDEWLVGYGCDQAGYARAEENLKYLPKEAQRRLGYSS